MNLAINGTAPPRARLGRGLLARLDVPGGRHRKRPVRPPKRSSVGLILASILTLLTVLWFERHLYPYAKMRLGTDDGAFLSTLTAASAATYGFFKAQIDEKVKGLLALLSRPEAPRILGVGIFLVAVLLLSTTSIYVTLEGNGIDKNFEMLIRRESPSVTRPITLTHKSPTFFSLQFFPRLGPITFELRKPLGYALEVRQIGLGSAVRVRVPLDFRQKELHILRLVPGWGLLEVLPGADAKTTLHALRIRFSDGRTVDVELRRQPIYIGATSPELETAEKGDESNDWPKRLASAQGPLNNTQAAILAQVTESSPQYIDTPELSPGDTVRVDLLFHDTRSQEIHPIGSFQVIRSSSIQTIFLEERTP